MKIHEYQAKSLFKKYNIPITKITSGHRLALVGIAKEDIKE